MFIKAVPIFLKGKTTEMNVNAAFECVLPALNSPAVLRITASTRYKAYFRDEFLMYGPAKAAHGYARVDELPLKPGDAGALRIYVESSHVATFDGVKQPGFLIAEVVSDGEVLAATGYDFSGYVYASKLQKVMRFSYQRHFSEVYDGYNRLEPCETETVDNGMRYIPRDIKLPCTDMNLTVCVCAEGRFARVDRELTRQRYIDQVPDVSEGYTRAELEATPYDDYRSLAFDGEFVTRGGDYMPELKQGEYIMYDLGCVLTGFMRAHVTVTEPTELIISYEDYCPEPFVNTDRLDHQYINMVTWYLQPGEYELEAFDPCELRYMQLSALSGAVKVGRVQIRQYINPTQYAFEDTGDEVMNGIYGAAVETFRQNAVDVFMDCPTRERAGWLCDSYYTAQSEYAYTGDNEIERAFLRNFAMAGQVEGLPEGMLPMCYPADILGGEFIPQWAMWYLIELRDAILIRGGLDKEEFRTLCYRLIAFFDKYINADGLLESLPSWNFVEWSRCNDWTQDVNYPTNFLYVKALRAVGELYGDEALMQKAEALRRTAMALSFDGELFHDNAVRDPSGKLVNTNNVSETCQYYAVRFAGVDLNAPEYEYLKRACFEVFGPDHAGYDALRPDIEPSTPFMGIYLRLELLLQYGLYNKALDEIVGFFGGMAQLTGTLWEHKSPSRGSLNHGFASFAGVALERALEGIGKETDIL